jgi:hypothetical protein
MPNTSLFDTLLRKTAWTWYNLTRRRGLLKLWYYRVKRKAIRYHTLHPLAYDGIDDAIAYLRRHTLHTFPHPFIHDYLSQDISVYRDEQTGLLPYVMHEGKKLFFKRSYDDELVSKTYQRLLIEQDARSPHRYAEGAFCVTADDTLLDIGCAEGNFALSSVETAKHVVLFEGDTEWIEALEATFAPWREKVTIIPKWVGDADSNETVCIDSFLRERPADVPFLKIDVEGHEREVLKGAQQLLTSGSPMKMALCTYHLPHDYADFTALLAAHDFSLTSPPGVMLIHTNAPPYLRKALLRATR